MSGSYVRSVALLPVGDQWDMSLLDMAARAAEEALEGAGWPRVDAIVVSNMLAERLLSQGQLGALVAERAGLRGVRALRVEAGHASGGVAVATAHQLVRSGALERVLVLGVEKMRDSLSEDALEAMSMSEDAEHVLMTGSNIYTLGALLTRIYMDRYGVAYEDLLHFPLIAHANGAKAGHAQFRRPLTLKQALESPVVSDPVRLMDTPPMGDGAAAVLLTSDPSGAMAEIAFSDYSTSSVNSYLHGDPLSLPALSAVAAAARASGLDPAAADFLELHDTFSVMAALELEELGAAPRGGAPGLARSGRLSLDGELPISTFGGMKARGFPVGAAGVYQVAEAALQVSGGAGPNQVQGAELGAAVNLGGFGGTAALTIVRRRERCRSRPSLIGGRSAATTTWSDPRAGPAAPRSTRRPTRAHAAGAGTSSASNCGRAAGSSVTRPPWR
ncbi:MAG: thiolase domain-containing protein [Nitrososphaeria archaeon]|jgi:acetyl-CoA acetyltransferase